MPVQSTESRADVVSKREALEEMLALPGWQYFLQYAWQEWRGAGYVARMGTALATKDPIDPQVVHRTALEMARLLEWPASQVRDLKGVVYED
jgi:hypothetical protein